MPWGQASPAAEDVEAVTSTSVSGDHGVNEVPSLGEVVSASPAIELDPPVLRKYVERHAGPLRRVDLTPIPLWHPRRLEARRFVLAVAAPDDEAVDRELDQLQQRYAVDLEIELRRSIELSQMLVDRGPLVANLFGPASTEQVC